ncbi:hypothetical protein IV203_030023 [Nitzschia inconspicua]|uniref:Uncharacterized protein n=1 Tax=Nitzschia inconspicua TaxID=303405 RepID=A0A9K3LSB8_9STRA|nr:hypothetical protein IV203_030023 [Nitzschia inconspicua]
MSLMTSYQERIRLRKRLLKKSDPLALAFHIFSNSWTPTRTQKALVVSCWSLIDRASRIFLREHQHLFVEDNTIHESPCALSLTNHIHCCKYISVTEQLLGNNSIQSSSLMERSPRSQHASVSTSNLMAPSVEKDNRLTAGKSLREKRVEFALFLKVLLRCLGNAHPTSVQRQARLVVLACIRGHARGDPSFYPLEDVIEYQLRRIIDERIWDQAMRFTEFYLMRRGRSQASSTFYPPNPFIQFVLPDNNSRELVGLGERRLTPI